MGLNKGKLIRLLKAIGLTVLTVGICALYIFLLSLLPGNYDIIVACVVAFVCMVWIIYKEIGRNE